MKKLLPFLFLFIAFGLLCFSSCSKKDGEDTTQVQSPSSESDVLGKSSLIFNSLNIQNNSASTSVPNSTETFSFLEEISTQKNSQFIVALDEFGIHTSATKIVPLNIGDNKFFIFETVDGKVQNTYTINIRRRPIYTVTFNSDNGSYIESQNVEEGSFAISRIVAMSFCEPRS